MKPIELERKNGTLKRMLVILGSLSPLVLSLWAGTSQLNSVWYDRNFQKVPLKKILVVGLSTDREKRESFEDTFVTIIRQHGGEADSGLATIPGQNFQEEAVKKEMKEKGYDAVMVSRLVAVDVRTESVQGSKTRRPATPSNRYSSSFDNEYQREYDVVTTPGYLLEKQVLVIETKIFASNGNLIWSAKSENTDPLSIYDLVRSMAKAIGSDLSDKGLIRPPN